jgi:hypothetical protein
MCQQVLYGDVLLSLFPELLDDIGDLCRKGQFAAIYPHQNKGGGQLFGNGHNEEGIVFPCRALLLEVGMTDCFMQRDISAASDEHYGSVIKAS